MSGFSSEWLALREPLDLAARNRNVEEAFLKTLPSVAPTLLDLASGAGSTVAALKDRMPSAASWMLSDYDPALLEVASARWKDRLQGELSLHRIDLARALEDLPFADVDAITTSAFLDLVSEDFILRLVDCVVRARKPFLASLSYDGRAGFDPSHDLDSALKGSMNQDQRTDKGFGVALGPDAARRAIELFKARGYRVVEGFSDWHVEPADKDFLEEFLSGWKNLGLRKGLSSDALEDWWRQRSNQIRSSQISLTIGHIDFTAVPA